MHNDPCIIWRYTKIVYHRGLRVWPIVPKWPGRRLRHARSFAGWKSTRFFTVSFHVNHADFPAAENRKTIPTASLLYPVSCFVICGAKWVSFFPPYVLRRVVSVKGCFRGVFSYWYCIFDSVEDRVFILILKIVFVWGKLCCYRFRISWNVMYVDISDSYDKRIFFLLLYNPINLSEKRVQSRWKFYSI